MARPATTGVYVEIGKKRVFASALAWPGWARSGKSEEVALETLSAYADRYAAIVEPAGLTFPAEIGQVLTVVERVQGNATTDFGAPDKPASTDDLPFLQEEADAAAAILQSSWNRLADLATDAPTELRKGPRGGGRDRDGVVQHVLNAEAAYARKLGIRQRAPSIDDPEAIDTLHEAILELVMSLPKESSAEPLSRGWLPRYAIRRIAWHVIDHIWEIEDKSDQ